MYLYSYYNVVNINLKRIIEISKLNQYKILNRYYCNIIITSCFPSENLISRMLNCHYKMYDYIQYDIEFKIKLLSNSPLEFVSD